MQASSRLSLCGMADAAVVNIIFKGKKNLLSAPIDHQFKYQMLIGIWNQHLIAMLMLIRCLYGHEEDQPLIQFTS